MAKQISLMAQWGERFLSVLNRYHREDPACMQITSDKEFARYVAVIIRRYVDRKFTEALYNDRTRRVGAIRTTAAGRSMAWKRSESIPLSRTGDGSILSLEGCGAGSCTGTSVA